MIYRVIDLWVIRALTLAAVNKRQEFMGMVLFDLMHPEERQGLPRGG